MDETPDIIVTDEEFAALKQMRCTVTDLRVRNGELARAFANLDKERCFLRKRAKRIRELAQQLEAECAMYEGQDNGNG